MKSRRSFLKLAGGASLWAAGGCIGFPGITSVRSPNSLLSHAAIGTKNMARYDLTQFLKNPKVRVTALCDVDSAFLAEAKALVPDARIYRDWRELLASEGDRIDSVNVSTPDHTHAMILAEAMRRGKHVYSQKPLCKFLDESAYLRELAADRDLVTQLGTQIAASVNDRLCVAILRSGMFGPVKNVKLFSTRDGKSRAERKVPEAKPVPATLDWDAWIGPAPMREYSPVYHPQLWRMFTDFGSGWVGDLCIHVMSAVWQGMDLGATMPRSVSAKVDAAALSGTPAVRGTWPRYSHIVWKMPGVKASGGKPFDLEWLSGFSQDPATPKEFLPPTDVFAKLPLEGRIIECERAWMMVGHGWGEKKTEIVMKDGSKVPPLPQIDEGPTHYEEFVERCFDGKKAQSDFSWTARMMDAVMVGGAAERMPNVELKWDAAAAKLENAAADRLLRSDYRSGWRLA